MKSNIRVYNGSSREGATHSLRLRFSYKTNSIKLESVQSIEMKSPPTDTTEPELDQSGFWHELKNAKGKVLYRRFGADPRKLAVEVSSDDPKAPLKWEKVKDAAGEFVLLVPALKEAKSIALFSSPFDTAKKDAQAKEIAHFDITSKKPKRK